MLKSCLDLVIVADLFSAYSALKLFIQCLIIYNFIKTHLFPACVQKNVSHISLMLVKSAVYEDRTLSNDLQ